MTTELAAHIQQTPLCDTHEHLRKEHTWIDEGPDILQDLFGNYVAADLKTAGANAAAIERLLHKPEEPVSDRFRDIQNAWHATQFTGYGEAVRLIASKIYGMEEVTLDGLDQAQTRLTDLRRPGGRYDLLKNVANLDHIQTDDACWPCLPDRSGLDFFFYDISWAGFCNGHIDPGAIEAETSVAVNDLNSLDNSMAAIFAKYASVAIAVKAQHAYNRTLLWEERTREDASQALEAVLSEGPENVPEATRLCLGDWCWARGIELAVEHDLPFKIHTGYYAGNDRMPVDRIRAGNMCPLLAKYLDARFVLMHIAYPYNNELIAIAKHYSNVWVDLCWAWSIDPFSSADFVRRFIHTVPANKLFGFGGDTGWPTSSAAYAIQMRHWFSRAMESEVAEGLLTEKQAMHIASRIMHDNQYDCFDLEGTRRNIASAVL